MYRKILIMGLPDAGKTTLARILAARLNAAHFKADEVRQHINKDLGFSAADRIEHAPRMGWLCDQVIKTGCFALADFICPNAADAPCLHRGRPGVRRLVDRIEKSAFEDNNRMFRAARIMGRACHGRRIGRVLGGAGGAEGAADLRSKATNGAVRRPLSAVS
jgi:adenylylsulfate kinase